MSEINVKARALARSAPGRRQFAEEYLDPTPEREKRGDTAPIAFVRELIEHANELEAKVFMGQREERARAEATEPTVEEQLDATLREADFRPDFAEAVRKGLEVIEPLAPALRKLSGVLTLRETAALHLYARQVWSHPHPDDKRRIAQQSWHLADAFVDAQPKTGGGA